MTYESWLANPLVEALGQSLLHFLWQGVLLALAHWLLSAAVARSTSLLRTARIRYGLGCVVMVLMVVSVVATVVHNYPEARQTGGITAVSLAPLRFISPDNAISAAAPGIWHIGLSGWVVSLWLVGVLFISMRTFGGWIRASIMKRRGCNPVSPELAELFECLKQRLHVAPTVRLCASAAAKAPMVIGWIRPLILLPWVAMTGFTELQLQAILAHELAHIRRHDYLVNLLQTAVETVLFYHPAVWWISHQIRIERENCCDDQAVEVCGDTAGYARALAQLEELRLQMPEGAIAATGGALLQRIRRLLEPEQSKPVPRAMAAAVAAIFVISVVAVPAMLSSGTTQQNAQRNVEPAPTVPGQQPESPSAKQDGPVEQEHNIQAANYERLARQVERAAQAYSKWLGPDVTYNPKNGPSTQSTEMLLKLFDSSTDVEIKGQILDYLADSKSPNAVEKLLSIARSGKDPELRQRAIDYVASRPDAFDILVSLYDGNPGPDIKEHILDYIGSSKDPRALEKLFSIAQSDPDREMRRMAVDYIASR